MKRKRARERLNMEREIERLNMERREVGQKDRGDVEREMETKTEID